MRICIFGAGAVGGLIAARLARSGATVSVAARGAALQAISERGLSVTDREGEWSIRPAAVGRPEELGPQDVLIVATKAHVLPAAAEALQTLLGAETTVVTAVNGIPWWYFHGLPESTGSPHLDCVDPGGRLWKHIGPERAIGCLLHLGASVKAPGSIHHAYGAQIVLGEPDGTMSARLGAISAALQGAGLKVRAVPDIRTEVWKKLRYNLAINPVSVVTGAACDRVSADPELMDLMQRMMVESAGISRALGIDEPLDAAAQVEGFSRIGAFKTSMLQDLEAGRSIELDPILGSLVELADRCAVDAPAIRQVYAFARHRALTAGCYRPVSEVATTEKP